jgi:hypothetical protein
MKELTQKEFKTVILNDIKISRKELAKARRMYYSLLEGKAYEKLLSKEVEDIIFTNIIKEHGKFPIK